MRRSPTWVSPSEETAHGGVCDDDTDSYNQYCDKAAKRCKDHPKCESDKDCPDEKTCDNYKECRG